MNEELTEVDWGKNPYELWNYMLLRFISFIPFDKNDGTDTFFYLDSYPYFFIFIKFDSFSLAIVDDPSLLE